MFRDARYRGAILADDMGLGKTSIILSIFMLNNYAQSIITVQTLAAIVEFFNTTKSLNPHPVLIIAPCSTTARNWVLELKKFTENLAWFPCLKSSVRKYVTSFIL